MVDVRGNTIAETPPGVTTPPGGRRFGVARLRAAPRWVRLGAATGAVVAGLAGVSVVLTIVAARTAVGSSDQATVALQGAAMARGHVLLPGWTLSYDSLWSVDSVFYMVAVAVAGVRAALLDAIPAIVAALTLLVGGWLAREGRKGVPAVVAVAAVAGVVALPSHTFSVGLLEAPHVATTLWCLLAFAGVRRGRFGWGWALAVVLLAAGLLGDLLTVGLGVVPVVVAGLLAMARRRDWRAGMASLTAGPASVVLALVVRGIAQLLGTLHLVSAHDLASFAQMKHNARHLPADWAHVFGFGADPYGSRGVPPLLEAVYVVGLLVVSLSVAVVVVRLVAGALRSDARRAPATAGGAPASGRPKSGAPALGAEPRSDALELWRLDDLLVVGFFGALVTYVALAVSDDPAYWRYLTPAVILGAVLAGRELARLAMVLGAGTIRRSASALGVAVLAALCAAVGFQATAPPLYQPAATLGRFLAAHHLREGVGDYWSASIVTVESKKKVAVRPVIADATGHLVRYGRLSTTSWYTDKPFQFLVYNTALPWGAVSPVTATATFGSPSKTYAVGSYRVLVWPKPFAVSPVTSVR